MRDIIVVGFSAGGVEAMARVMVDLPPTLPVAVLVVHHFPSAGTSALPRILGRAGHLPVRHAVHGEPIVPGQVYVGPPDRHLLVENETLVLARGPRENGHRPAIDPLFRTAAKAYGPRVIGMLLSGTLDDGTAGLMMIKAGGGLGVVQAPADALYGGMPGSALAHVQIDYAVPVAELGRLLVRLVKEPAVAAQEAGGTMAPQEQHTPDSALGGAHDLEDVDTGAPSSLTCPECGGALWELRNGELVRYRCHVGHAFTAENMVTQQAEALEMALWTAIRALEEKAELSRRLAGRARGQGSGRSAKQFDFAASEAEKGSETIRQLVTSTVDDVPQAEGEQ